MASDRLKDELRTSPQPLIDELGKHGHTVQANRKFRCPFHKDGKEKTPSASITDKGQSGGVWRLTCKAASCKFSGDIFDVRAALEKRPTADVMRDFRRETKKGTSRGRPGEDAKDAGKFFKTHERLNRPGQDDRHTGKSATADHGRDAHKPVIVPIDPPVDENGKQKTGDWVSFDGTDTRVFDSHDAWFQFYAKLPGTTKIIDHSPGYADLETGEMTWLKLRREPGYSGKGKTFQAAHVRDDGKVYGRWPKDVPQPLYVNATARELYAKGKLHELIVAEGEKAADALDALQLAAVSVPFGADAYGGKIDTVDWSAVRDAKVSLWPDHDPVGAIPARNGKPAFQGQAGHEFMKHVARHLAQQCGCATSWIDPDKLGLTDKQDAADFVGANHGATTDRLVEMIRAATGPVPRHTDEPATAPESGAAVKPADELEGEATPAPATAFFPTHDRIAASVKPVVVECLEGDASHTPADDRISEWKPFPVDQLPPVMRDLVMEAEEATIADASYTALPLLVCAGAAIGNSTVLRLKSSWKESTNLWCACIGRPSSKKGPMQRVATDGIFQFEAEGDDAYANALAEYQQQIKDWESEGADPDKEPSSPTQAIHRYTNKGTVEAITDVLHESPRGIVVIREELHGLLKSMNQYRNGKGSDVDDFLEFYDTVGLKSIRKTGDRKVTKVSRAFVAIAGGIQPDRFASAIMKDEDFKSGFAQRFIMTMPPRNLNTDWDEAEIGEQTMCRARKMIADLYRIPMDEVRGRSSPREIRFSPAAKELWVPFHNELKQLESQAELLPNDPQRDSYGKLIAVSARLSTILQQTSFVSGERSARSDLVDETSASRAVNITRWLMNEQRRIFLTLRKAQATSQLDEDAAYVKRKGGSITARDFQQGKNTTAKPVKKVDAESRLDALVAARRAVKHDETYHLTAE